MLSSSIKLYDFLCDGVVFIRSEPRVIYIYSAFDFKGTDVSLVMAK